MGKKENVLCLKKEGMFCAAINFDDKDQILNGVGTDLWFCLGTYFCLLLF